MSQSLSNVIVYPVFSVGDHCPMLKDRGIRVQMHAELGGTSKALNCPPIIAGGVDDHIHLLARQSRTITLSDWVKELNRVTSIWIKEKGPEYSTFSRQSGYGAFSVSQSQLNRVIEYVRHQGEHHKNNDFKTEFREFLERHEIESDERYVWG